MAQCYTMTRRMLFQFFETYPPSSLLLAGAAVLALIEGVHIIVVLAGTGIYALGHKLDMWGIDR